METEENATKVAPPTPHTGKKVLVAVLLVAAITLGCGAGYFAREKTIKNLQIQVTQLTKQLAELEQQGEKAAMTKNTAINETKLIYKYGARIEIPKALGDLSESETVIPLGAGGKYTVKSILLDAKTNPNITILVSTDAIVYENFIRTGTQAITPDPNTLTPGSPLLINGAAFCPALGSSTQCSYDAETNTAVFEKTYTEGQGDPYTIWGSVRFLPVPANDVGKVAAVIITRVSSNNQELIDWSRQIAVSAKK